MPRAKMTKRGRPLAAEIVINIGVAISLGLVIYGLLVNTTAQQQLIIGRIDLIISLSLLIEFIVRLKLAPNRRRYMARYWWLLLATIPLPIPAVEALKAIRLAEALRFLRLSDHIAFESHQ